MLSWRLPRGYAAAASGICSRSGHVLMIQKRLYLPRLPGVEMPASKNNVMTRNHSCLPGTCQ